MFLMSHVDFTKIIILGVYYAQIYDKPERRYKKNSGKISLAIGGDASVVRILLEIIFLTHILTFATG